MNHLLGLTLIYAPLVVLYTWSWFLVLREPNTVKFFTHAFFFLGMFALIITGISLL